MQASVSHSEAGPRGVTVSSAPEEGSMPGPEHLLVCLAQCLVVGGHVAVEVHVVGIEPVGQVGIGRSVEAARIKRKLQGRLRLLVPKATSTTLHTDLMASARCWPSREISDENLLGCWVIPDGPVTACGSDCMQHNCICRLMGP